MFTVIMVKKRELEPCENVSNVLSREQKSKTPTWAIQRIYSIAGASSFHNSIQQDISIVMKQ